MSREERRQYERMMRNMERGPAVPPAARARAERIAARRARRQQQQASSPGALTRGYVVRSVVVAFVAGLIAFSLQWPNMPWALYLGLIVGAAILGLLIGFRLLQRRVSPPAS
jgi:protein-S-isoprenylcysteine O-methyltransferase Ste14